MNTLLSFKALIHTVKKYALVIVALTVTGAGLGLGVAKLLITPHYQSTATVVVNREDKGEYGTLAEALTQDQADTQMLATYKDVLTKPVILDSVSASLTKKQQKALGGDLASAVSVDNTVNSRVFTISVRSTDRKLSAQVANKIVSVFKVKIVGIVANAKSISVIDKAVPALNQSASQSKLFLLGGAIIGFLIGLCCTLSEALFSRKIKTLSYFDDVNVPVWGEVLK